MTGIIFKGEDVTKKTGEKAPYQGTAQETAVATACREDTASLIGAAVGRMAATLADALPRLEPANGKRLCRQLAAIVKAEAEALD